jgi:hypothetical protein
MNRRWSPQFVSSGRSRRFTYSISSRPPCGLLRREFWPLRIFQLQRLSKLVLEVNVVLINKSHEWQSAYITNDMRSQRLDLNSPVAEEYSLHLARSKALKRTHQASICGRENQTSTFHPGDRAMIVVVVHIGKDEF